ncbi:MAG: PASTA domain-containing protein [Candidatus Cloacimonetes bacterium]|nr:PASTA domain-containing protein [Candidatus Cloacimonadota bacterium]
MKFKAFILSVLIFLGIFILGIVIMNLAMKFIVKNQSEVEVPTLIGLDYEEAKDLCSERNLYIAVSDYEYHELPKNVIVSQNPYSGKSVFENRTVYVVLSLGSKKVTVPNLTNYYVDDVSQILKKHDLKMGLTEFEYSGSVQQNYVIYTIPRAGTSVMAGDSVRVIVSSGSDPNAPDSLLDYPTDTDDEAYEY